jgi:uncharacterized membrane protein HdeD (DUF308 family)
MNDDNKNADDFKSEYRSDKKWNGWFSICIGLLILACSGFDIATSFWEEYWYANIFTILFGLVFIVYGILDVRKHTSSKSK